MTVNSILIVPFSLHKRQTTFVILILFSLCWYMYSHVYLCSIDYSLSFSILQPILMCMRNYFKIFWIIMREKFHSFIHRYPLSDFAIQKLPMNLYTLFWYHLPISLFPNVTWFKKHYSSSFLNIFQQFEKSLDPPLAAY